MMDDGTLTVGQRLGRIEADIREVLTEVRGSAREPDVRELRTRIEILEKNTVSTGAVDSYRRWLASFAAGLLLEGAGLVYMVLRGGHP